MSDEERPDHGERLAAAALRVYGPAPSARPPRLGNFDPDELTAILGISPSHSHRLGERPVNEPDAGFTWLATSWLHSMWELSSDRGVVSDNLTDHLVWLLDRVLPVAPLLTQYLQDHDLAADIYCMMQVEGDERSLVLPPPVLEGLHRLGVLLDVEVYCLS